MVFGRQGKGWTVVWVDRQWSISATLTSIIISMVFSGYKLIMQKKELMPTRIQTLSSKTPRMASQSNSKKRGILIQVLLQDSGQLELTSPLSEMSNQ